MYIDQDENADLNKYLTDEKFIKEVLTDMNQLATKNKFSGLERVKQIHLTLEPFTIENDILTPSMKVKRNVAKKVFEKEIAELYAKPL